MLGILLRRQAVLEVGGYDEKCSIEDLDLWLKMGRRHRFAFVEEPHVLYRQHSTNTAVRQSERILFDELDLMLRELDECIARGIVPRWRSRVTQFITAARLMATNSEQAVEAAVCESGRQWVWRCHRRWAAGPASFGACCIPKWF